jgi:hypothetical protein
VLTLWSGNRGLPVGQPAPLPCSPPTPPQRHNLKAACGCNCVHQHGPRWACHRARLQSHATSALASYQKYFWQRRPLTCNMRLRLRRAPAQTMVCYAPSGARLGLPSPRAIHILPCSYRPPVPASLSTAARINMHKCHDCQHLVGKSDCGLGCALMAGRSGHNPCPDVCNLVVAKGVYNPFRQLDCRHPRVRPAA